MPDPLTDAELAELKTAAEAATQIAYDAPNDEGEWKIHDEFNREANPATVLRLVAELTAFRSNCEAKRHYGYYCEANDES